MKYLSTILILTLGFLIETCKDSATDPSLWPVQLNVQDVGVTDAYLHIQVPSRKGRLTIERDGATILDVVASTLDTFVIDDSLLPKHTYSYKAKLITSKYTYETPDLVVTTMDTTSHDYVWRIDKLGDGNSSMLNDVSMLNDTLCYLVGELYLMDLTGLFQVDPFNLAKWNGTGWELVRVPTATFGGYIDTLPLATTFAFGSSDIWTFSIAGSYSHWNGSSWSTAYVAERSGGGKKLWGTSADNLFLVGTDGCISHYSRGTWSRMDAQTALDFHDIYGAMNPRTNSTEIFAVASKPFSGYERKISSIQDNAVVSVSDSGIKSALTGVWFVPGSQYWVVGDGMWQKQLISGRSVWRGGPRIVTDYFINAVRGNAINDVFACGASGEILHFNGMTWKSYRNLTGLSHGEYNAIAVKGNIVVAVGYDGSRAVVARGRR